MIAGSGSRVGIRIVFIPADALAIFFGAFAIGCPPMRLAARVGGAAMIRFACVRR
jgi:hypothetical protein